MSKTAFVVLHYMAEDVTSACLDCLQKNFPGTGVVVVDNASPDGSGERLKNHYADSPDIHFVKMKKNVGFARGNNAGYRYAVENLNPDFIVVMNNDVMINDKSFLDQIAEEYAKEPFAVLGPDIFSPKVGIHQNPARIRPLSYDEALSLHRKMYLKSEHYLSRYIGWKIKKFLHLAREERRAKNEWTKAQKGCVLHGACYIFSSDFINARKDAFCPNTFLYFEEDILNRECQMQKLVMRYTPALRVIHLEDRSTKAAFTSEYRRGKMKYRHLTESIEVFLDSFKKS